MPVKLTQQSNTNAQLPYERFQQFGPENLTEAELLAVILRTGTKDTSAVELAEKGPGTGKNIPGKDFWAARCKRGGIDTDPWDRHSESSEN